MDGKIDKRKVRTANKSDRQVTGGKVIPAMLSAASSQVDEWMDGWMFGLTDEWMEGLEFVLEGFGRWGLLTGRKRETNKQKKSNNCDKDTRMLLFPSLCVSSTLLLLSALSMGAHVKSEL